MSLTKTYESKYKITPHDICALSSNGKYFVCCSESQYIQFFGTDEYIRCVIDTKIHIPDTAHIAISNDAQYIGISYISETTGCAISAIFTDGKTYTLRDTDNAIIAIKSIAFCGDVLHSLNLVSNEELLLTSFTPVIEKYTWYKCPKSLSIMSRVSLSCTHLQVYDNVLYLVSYGAAGAITLRLGKLTVDSPVILPHGGKLVPEVRNGYGWLSDIHKLMIICNDGMIRVANM